MPTVEFEDERGGWNSLDETEKCTLGRSASTLRIDAFFDPIDLF